jgi:hypothetical protein
VSENPNPEEPKPAEGQPAEPAPDTADKDQIGEFITRHILEKDTVFFEG